MPIPSPDEASQSNLSDRVVLITGASGGLGRPLALACAARGATVVIHGRIVRKLEALYDDIVNAGHPQPTIMPLDFATASADSFDETAGAIRAQLGRLDALVHTAAFLGSLGPLEHQSVDAWSKAYAINVGAAMALTRACLPLLMRAPDASVVFTLDTRAFDPRAYWGAYGATKAAVAALAATLADETENRANVRVNAVVPGPIRSPLRMLTHPAEDRASLPAPDAIVPLYLHLIAGQPKSESGMRLDAQTWLAGQPAATPLVSGSGVSRP
jgi:NAD(P)-dependent dehydrogenase (short-subunit alcohol dehydrogenase family)